MFYYSTLTGTKEAIPEPEITKKLEEVEVLRGQPILLECHVANAADAQVKWFHNDIVVTQDERISVSFNGTICTLFIEKSVLDDEGKYMCEIRNDQGMVSSTGEVIVEEGMSLPIFQQKMQNLNVIEGENACFDVRVTGNPEPVVEWVKDGFQLEDEGRVMIIDDVDENEPELFSLVIENCQHSDTGQYQCLAMNEAGKAECLAQLLVFPVSDSIRAPDSSDIPLIFSEGQDVTLKALMIKDSVATWGKDDEPINQSSHFEVGSAEGVHTLTIRGVTSDDTGIYKCETDANTTSIFNVTIKGKLFSVLRFTCYFAEKSPYSQMAAN